MLWFYGLLVAMIGSHNGAMARDVVRCLMDCVCVWTTCFHCSNTHSFIVRHRTDRVVLLVMELEVYADLTRLASLPRRTVNVMEKVKKGNYRLIRSPFIQEQLF
jgi:hypothetical protein